MKRYLLVIKGQGEGCDYTIGCNILVEEIEGDTPYNAFLNWFLEREGVETIEEYKDDYNYNPNEFDSVELYAITEECAVIDLDKFGEQFEEIEEKSEEEVDPEYNQYMKLKAKFESGTKSIINKPLINYPLIHASIAWKFGGNDET